MNISPEIYKALTPAQRIAATIAAIARNDDRERQTLVESCPRKTYRSTDLQFLDGLENIKTLGIFVENELRGLALDWLVAVRLDQGDLVDIIPEQIKTLATAWEALAVECGIDPADLNRATIPRHDTVTGLLLIADQPDPAGVAANLEVLRSYLTS